MIKKVVWGLVALVLVGILVAGAIVRTAAKTGDVEGAQGAFGRERGGGQGQGLGLEDEAGTGQAQVDEWITVQGSVVEIGEDLLLVAGDEGTEIVVENRPWQFAQEQGFAAQAGDRLTLTAFYEGDRLEVGQVANERTGQSVRLRDESGRPMWAGRGRRNG